MVKMTAVSVETCSTNLKVLSFSLKYWLAYWYQDVKMYSWVDNQGSEVYLCVVKEPPPQPTTNDKFLQPIPIYCVVCTCHHIFYNSVVTTKLCKWMVSHTQHKHPPTSNTCKCINVITTTVHCIKPHCCLMLLLDVLTGHDRGRWLAYECVVNTRLETLCGCYNTFRLRIRLAVDQDSELFSTIFPSRFGL